MEIKDSLIKTHVNVSNWEEAIQVGGTLLLNEGLIDKEYIQRMIDSVHELGPYIVLFPGFALAHSSPGSDVYETGLSFITLMNPVEFGHDQNDPVSLVATLATRNSEEHMDVLMELAHLMSNEKIFSEIIECNTVEELQALLRKEN